MLRIWGKWVLLMSLLGLSACAQPAAKAVQVSKADFLPVLEEVFHFEVKRGTLYQMVIKRPKRVPQLGDFVKQERHYLEFLAWHHLALPIWVKGGTFTEEQGVAFLRTQRNCHEDVAELMHCFLAASGGGVEGYVASEPAMFSRDEVMAAATRFFSPNGDDNGKFCIAAGPLSDQARKQLLLEAMCYSAFKRDKKTQKFLTKRWSRAFRQHMTETDGNSSLASERAGNDLMDDEDLWALLWREYERLKGALPFTVAEKG